METLSIEWTLDGRWHLERYNEHIKLINDIEFLHHRIRNRLGMREIIDIEFSDYIGYHTVSMLVSFNQDVFVPDEVNKQTVKEQIVMNNL